jgi:hypothetical protein
MGSTLRSIFIGLGVVASGACTPFSGSGDDDAPGPSGVVDASVDAAPEAAAPIVDAGLDAEAGPSLCLDDKGNERPSPTAFMDKPSYARGDTARMTVMWKGNTINLVQVARTSGGFYCAGSAGGTDTAIDPGPNCAGWSAHVRTIDTSDTGLLKQGANTIEAHINPRTTGEGGGACVDPQQRPSTTLTVN